jgi:hypothetical protein
VTGPREILTDADCGLIHADLREAALGALHLPREACRAFALRHDLAESARSFLGNLSGALRLQPFG